MNSISKLTLIALLIATLTSSSSLIKMEKSTLERTTYDSGSRGTRYITEIKVVTSAKESVSSVGHRGTRSEQTLATSSKSVETIGSRGTR